MRNCSYTNNVNAEPMASRFSTVPTVVVSATATLATKMDQVPTIGRLHFQASAAGAVSIAAQLGLRRPIGH